MAPNMEFGDGRYVAVADGNRLGALGRAYSVSILGAIVKALAAGDFLGTRTAKRFFAGDTTTDGHRTKVFEDVAAALVDVGVVTPSELLRREDVSRALEEAALRWDETVATLQSRAGALGAGVAERVLRFVVIDLSVRSFAVLRLEKRPAPELGTPLWARRNGGGLFLRRLAFAAKTTREQLAERLNVSNNAVDNWFDGANRPTRVNMARLADALAGEGDAAAVERAIRRCFAFSELADRLANVLGRDRIEELAATWVRFVRAISEDVGEMDRLPVEESARTELVALWWGSAHPMIHTLLRNLAGMEDDANWRRDILAAMRPWRFELEWQAARAGPPSAAGLAQDAPELADNSPEAALAKEADDRAMAAFRRIHESRDSFGGRDLASEVGRVRSIAQTHPASAQAHYVAGSYLGMVGKWLARDDLVKEGIGECWIAARLLPAWDAPAVEPGVILGNVGKFEAAMSELARAEEWLGGTTPHLLLVRAHALMGLSRHKEALTDLEVVLAERPDYALALDWARRCAFGSGDRRKGLGLARRAMRFGAPDEYIGWWSQRDG